MILCKLHNKYSMSLSSYIKPEMLLKFILDGPLPVLNETWHIGHDARLCPPNPTAPHTPLTGHKRAGMRLGVKI